MMKSKSGIYNITNKTNGHQYIGSAVNLQKRKRGHFRELRKQVHANDHLQKAYNKYGEDAFTFEVLEYWEPAFLVSMEQWWMNMLAPEYNIAPVAGNQLGYKHTTDAKVKISAAQKGKPRSAETKAKISAAHKGKKLAAEHKAKLSEWQEGRKLTDEHKANMSAANKGKPWSPARRAAYEAKKESE